MLIVLFCSSYSSYGQTLDTTTYIGETLFCISTCIFGLILFSQLIGNMQVMLMTIFFMFVYQNSHLKSNFVGCFEDMF